MLSKENVREVAQRVVLVSNEDDNYGELWVCYEIDEQYRSEKTFGHGQAGYVFWTKLKLLYDGFSMWTRGSENRIGMFSDTL